jgi:ethanolamine utilization protein EutQ (cupin superfamily)
MTDARMRVQKLTIADTSWAQVGDQQIFTSDLIDAATNPDAKMTVGYARMTKDESFEISFPYDEVLIVTKGSYTTRTEQGETVTARAGEVVYLPAGSSNTHRADEDTEMVYVASPPSVYAAHVAAAADAAEDQ